MKKLFILLTLIIFAFSGNAFAQKNLTARQLFMLLPDDYVSGTKTERETALVFPNSIKSDFLTFMISGKLVPKNLAGNFAEPEGLGDLRVFKGKSSVVVGLRYQLGDGQETNPTIDTTKLVTVLLEYKNKKWTVVTDSLMPKISADEAYQTLVKFPDTKDVKKENVWVETQVSKDQNGLLFVGRAKGSETATPLKFFKWNGAAFVEAEFQ